MSNDNIELDLGTVLRQRSSPSDLAGDLQPLILTQKTKDHPELHFPGANFDGLDLRGFDFRRAILPGASFNGANLEGVILWDADLTGADLSKSIGLLAENLAGAVLTTAKLPFDLKDFPGLREVQQLSESAGKVFLTILAAVAFILITIASVPDSEFVVNSHTSELPIIGAKVPIHLFYAAAPITLLLLFLYMHLYLQRLWTAIARLPAVFSDGRTVDATTYQWMLNDIGRGFFYKLKADSPPLFHLQTATAWLLGWFLVPVVQSVIWANALRVQVTTLTALHIIVTSISIGAALAFLFLARNTFHVRRKGPARMSVLNEQLAICSGCLAVALSSLILQQMTQNVWMAVHIPSSPWIFRQLSSFFGNNNGDEKQPGAFGPITCEMLLTVGISPRLIMPNGQLSQKPQFWTGDANKAKVEIPEVNGAKLQFRSLRNAWAWNCFLVNAELHGATLSEALLQNSDLRGAHLLQVIARRTRFDRNRFSCSIDEAPCACVIADLWGAKCEDSTFNYSTMNFVTFHECLFTNARFDEVKAKETSWHNCTFKRATFVGADLSNSTFWVDSHSTEMGNVDFSRAILRGVKFGQVSLDGVKFDEADLEDADLSKATGLTDEQLKPAKNLHNTILPSPIAEQLKQRTEGSVVNAH